MLRSLWLVILLSYLITGSARVNGCDDGWVSVADDCLLAGQNALNFSEARQYCRNINSRLVFLRNYGFNQLLQAAMLNTESGFVNNSTDITKVKFWTGVSISKHMEVKWLDTSYTDASMSQLPGLPALLPRFNGQHGALYFTDESSLAIKFLEASGVALPLCARQSEPSPNLSAVAYDPAVGCPGPNATLQHGRCYRLLNAESIVNPNFNRSVALEACRNWSANASLAVVNDYSAQFLAAALISAEARGHTWLDLRHHKNGFWAWRNATEFPVYANWKLGEPSMFPTGETCVIAHQREASLGEWNNVRCDDRFASALCQAAPVVADDVSEYPAKPIGVAGAGNCRDGFYEYENACWFLAPPSNALAANDTRVWNSSGSRNQSAAACAAMNASLAFFHQRGDQAFLSALAEQLGSLDGSVWLGLNLEHAEHDWILSWDDGSSANYQFVWEQLPSQVKNTNNDLLCATLSLANNSLTARPCNATAPRLACRYNLPEHPMSPNNSQALRCPEPTAGQHSSPSPVNGKCFRLLGLKGSSKAYDSQHSAATWEAARNSCLALDGELASVHSRVENDAVGQLLKKSGGEAWIGLRLLSEEVTGRQHFAWSDGSGLGFFHFRHGHPAIKESGYLECVKASQNYVEWLSASCSVTLPYICQIQGLPPLPTTAAATTAATTPTPAAAENASTSTSTSTPSVTSAPVEATTSASTSPYQCRPPSMPTPDGAGCVDFLYSASEKQKITNWFEADDWCRLKSGKEYQLASVSSQSEMDALLRLVGPGSAAGASSTGGKSNQLVWLGARTGLSSVANAYTVWSDGSPLRYANFAPPSPSPSPESPTTQPDFDIANRFMCAAMEFGAESHYPGAWRSQPCNTTKLPFLCKRTRHRNPSSAATTTTAAPPPPSTGTSCPDGWTGGEGGACYRLLAKAVVFNEAMTECKKVGGEGLASYQTAEQLQRMASLLYQAEEEDQKEGVATAGGAASAWVGLYYRNTSLGDGGGVYAWLDERPVLHTDWSASVGVVISKTSSFQ